MKASFPFVIVFLAGSFVSLNAMAQDTPTPDPVPATPVDTTEAMPEDHDMTTMESDAADSVMTVEFILNEAPDDHPVVLHGTLTGSLDEEHYTFEDETGTIPVRIDDDVLGADDFTEGMEVELIGEVDKDSGEQTIVEVEEITIH